MVECALVETDHVCIRKPKLILNPVVESEPDVDFSFDDKHNLVDLFMLPKNSYLGLELNSF